MSESRPYNLCSRHSDMCFWPKAKFKKVLVLEQLLALLVPKKEGGWRMYVNSKVIRKDILWYRCPLLRFDYLLDQLSGATFL